MTILVSIDKPSPVQHEGRVRKHGTLISELQEARVNVVFEVRHQSGIVGSKRAP